jgi:putative DNA primase/helicase
MSDEIRKEIAEAVEQEREQYQQEQAEKEAQKPVPGSGQGKGYIDQLKKDFDDNHLGDARRFSERFDGKLAFDNIQGRWYQYNCTHWFQDKGRVHKHLVAEVAGDYVTQAAYYDRRIREEMSKPEFMALAKTDKKDLLQPLRQKQKAWAARAKDLKDPTRINKVLDMASVATPGYLGMVGKEWNLDPYLFACGNKVLDLRSGKALDPDPRFFINRASTIEWQGLHAESLLWDEFLLQVFNQDKELIDYIQKCVGYWMTGLMTHQEFYCLWGPQGRNGKGVFFRTLRMVMGSYFQMMPSKYLLDEKSLQNTDKPDQHLVSLEHTRLACASEAPKRAKFSEGAIKQLSGGDPITCRGMYSLDVTEFIPKFKMLFATNRVPAVNGDDKAFQERLRIIKFPCTFKHGAEPDPVAKVYPMDPQLENKLHTPEHLPGILAWCVRGAMEFIDTGVLIPPDSVLSDTRDFMENNDFIGEFIRDCLDVHADAPKSNTPKECKAQMKDIYAVFKKWCIEEKSIPEQKVWAMRTLGSDFGNRSDIYRVSPQNLTFYNISIRPEWKGGNDGLF